MKNKFIPYLFLFKKGLLLILLVSLLHACSEEPVSLNQNAKTSAQALSSERGMGGENWKQTFTAHLTSEQERPVPVMTHGSGQAIFKLSKDGTMLSYKLIVNNVENITQAHIHCGGSEVAGPVVAFLFGFFPEGVTTNGVLVEGTITAANVIARPDSQECMGGVATFEQLIAKLQSGEAYVNVHTLAYPGGEIRGQIK